MRTTTTGSGSNGGDAAPTRLEDIMTTDVRAVEPSMSVQEAARLMRDEGIDAVVVTDDGKGFHGIVADRDLVTRVVALGGHPESTIVGDICNEEQASVDIGDDVAVAVEVMTEYEVPRIPVLEDGSVVGVVSLTDAASHLDGPTLLASIEAGGRL